MHTHMHAYTHTHARIHTHAYTYRHRWNDRETHRQTHTHTHTHIENNASSFESECWQWNMSNINECITGTCSVPYTIDQNIHKQQSSCDNNKNITNLFCFLFWNENKSLMRCTQWISTRTTKQYWQYNTFHNVISIDTCSGIRNTISPLPADEQK